MNKKIKVGIIGGGAMGSGIAQIAASVDCKVLLYDQILKILLRAMFQT